MRILQLNQYTGPEPFCPTYRPVHLAREWTRIGHETLCVGASFSHLFIAQPPLMRRTTTLRNDGVDFLLLKTNRYTGNGLGRVLSMFAFVAQLIRHLRLFYQFRPQIVIAGTTHLLDSYPAYLISRRTGAKFVREVRDLWPLTLIEVGGLSAHNPLVRVIQHAENFAYKKAHKVITTLSNSFEHMARHGLSRNRWCFIPQGIDLSALADHSETLGEPHSSLLQQCRRQNHLIVAYTGSLGLAYSLPTLMAAASLLRDEPVSFFLVGQGPMKEELETTAAAEGLKNVHILPPVPKRSVPALLSRVDVAFMGWSKRPLFKYGVSPNKLMDYMAAARPIIHAVELEDEPVTNCRCGFRVIPENADAIADAIRSFLKMPESERELMGCRGRDYVRSRHDYSRLAADYLEAVTA
jgi:glycosyltransferase involved in cell wall biosynthesis